jgi:hypothetical protein
LQRPVHPPALAQTVTVGCTPCSGSLLEMNISGATTEALTALLAGVLMIWFGVDVWSTGMIGGWRFR